MDDLTYLQVPIPNGGKPRSNNLSVDLTSPIPEPLSASSLANLNRSYSVDLTSPLPKEQATTRLTKVNWSGLNKRKTIDTGAMSAQSNISTEFAPCLSPSPFFEAMSNWVPEGSKPLGLYGFSDFLLAIYRVNGQICANYIRINENGAAVYKGVLWNDCDNWSEADRNFLGDKLREYIGTDPPRSVVKFNSYDTPGNPLDGKVVEKLLIFPDKKVMDFNISSDFELSNLSGIPDIRFAATHQARLFGVDGSRVYASGYNDYTNWNLDTAEEYQADNAWCSLVFANTRANGDFTGITTFDGHVTCFKEDYVYEITNNKNPFRVVDIYAEGAIEQRSIAVVGPYLIFTNSNGVKVYTGGQPRDIGHNLNLPEIKNAVAGTDGRRYYLYYNDGGSVLRHKMITFDTANMLWSEQKIDCEVAGFAQTYSGFYMLARNGNDSFIYKMDTGSYGHEWYAETDFYTGQTVDIKHIRKLQFLAEMDGYSWMKVFLLYDDNQNPQLVAEWRNSEGLTKRTFRVIPRKTANFGFKLRIEGYGFIKLHQMEIDIAKGGEWFVRQPDDRAT